MIYMYLLFSDNDDFPGGLEDLYHMDQVGVTQGTLQHPHLLKRHLLAVFAQTSSTEELGSEWLPSGSVDHTFHYSKFPSENKG